MTDESLILSLLTAMGESYGLDLVKASDGQLGRGTIYVTLSAMEDVGLVASREETVIDERIAIPRRLYRITERGRHALADADMLPRAVSP